MIYKHSVILIIIQEVPLTFIDSAHDIVHRAHDYQIKNYN